MRYKIEINQADLRNLNRKVRDLRAIDEKGLSGALKMAATTASNTAKRTAPVDTGNLRSQIGFERSPNGKGVEVFANAPYSAFVEFGTRFQKAQPYFMPAIRLAMAQLQRDLQHLINRAIR